MGPRSWARTSHYTCPPDRVPLLWTNWPEKGLRSIVGAIPCGQYLSNKEKRWWWARTGSHKGPFPTSTSSPAPTIHELGVSIRRIVGEPCLGDRYSGERMWWS